MAFNLLFAALAVATVVVARPPGGGHEGPGGHGGPGGPGGPHGGPGGHGLPPFLANVTAEGKKAFEEVFRNENLTIAEVDTQVAALAEKYGVSAVYKEFQANVTAHLAEVKKNQTEVINNLASVASQLETIFSNKDQTRKEQHEAVEALRKEHPAEVSAIQFIRAQFQGPKGPGGPGAPRGGPGGPGGHGGPRGGPKGKESQKKN